MNYQKPISSQKGFTLVELMIALAIGSLVAVGAFSAFQTQQRSNYIQDQVADMQQNLNAAFIFLSREIREAGCDPTEDAGAGIETATAGQLRFTRDIFGDAMNENDADGETDWAGEDLTFGFAPADDADGDGIPDSGNPADLTRTDVNGPNSPDPIAHNIQAIEFNYILDDNTTITSPALTQLNNIRAVQITLLARAGAQSNDYLDSTVYTTGSGANWGPFNDGYRRRIIMRTLQCRNIGL